MRMQEPQESQEWQVSQEYGEYRASTGQYDAEQQQKIYPKQEEHGGLMTKAAALVTVVLSCVSLTPAILSVDGSGITFYYFPGHPYMAVGGTMGPGAFILPMHLIIALSVV